MSTFSVHLPVLCVDDEMEWYLTLSFLAMRVLYIYTHQRE